MYMCLSLFPPLSSLSVFLPLLSPCACVCVCVALSFFSPRYTCFNGKIRYIWRRNDVSPTWNISPHVSLLSSFAVLISLSLLTYLLIYLSLARARSLSFCVHRFALSHLHSGSSHASPSSLLEPLFCDMTWGAGGSTSELTLELCLRMTKEVGVETNMHLTW